MQDELAAPPGGRGTPRQGVQAIARGALLLRALEAAPEGLSLTELAAEVGLAKSTVHRLAGALGAEGLLASTPDGRIVLGGALVRLAAAARRTLPQLLRPVLEQLHGTLGETVDLAVLDGSSVRFVDQLAATHRLRAVSAVGASFPLHCTANGKALLAALPEERALALLPSRLPRLTDATITSRAALRSELAEIRRQGVAFDREEHAEGICAVGAAVLDASGPVAAISVPVPATRFRGREQLYAAAVAAAAAQASRLLG
jgi:DNA-binding IclR family transcriptional regulator